MEQVCVRCDILKPFEQFPKTRSKKTKKEYHRHQCKQCSGELKAAWNRAHHKHVSALHKQWYQQQLETRQGYREILRQTHKSWRDKNREHVKQCAKVNELKRFYGLTLEDVSTMISEQGGKCAACGEFPDDTRPLMVDHDHRTGRVRGMLCNSCNLALGRARESINRLRGLILYMERQQTRQMPTNDATTGLIRIA